MPRCSICDYTTGDETPSLYHEGLANERQSYVLILNPKTNDWECVSCFEAINENIKELEEHDFKHIKIDTEIFETLKVKP